MVSTPRKEKRHAPGVESTSTRNGGIIDMSRVEVQGHQIETSATEKEKDCEEVQAEHPPKKKRRVILTRVGDLDL